MKLSEPLQVLDLRPYRADLPLRYSVSTVFMLWFGATGLGWLMLSKLYALAFVHAVVCVIMCNILFRKIERFHAERNNFLVPRRKLSRPMLLQNDQGFYEDELESDSYG